MGREAQRLHLPVKTQCFVHLGISCELGNRKNGTGDRQQAFTCEKPMFCAVWKKISSMHIDVIHNLFQHAQNIVFSQVDVHVSLVPFFPFP